MCINPLVANLDFRIAADDKLVVTFDIENSLGRDLSLWSLHFDLPKEILPGENTGLQSHVGSHVVLVASDNKPLIAGQSAELQFFGHRAIIQRYSDLPCGLYLHSGNDNIKVVIGGQNFAEIGLEAATLNYSPPPHSSAYMGAPPEYPRLSTPHNPAIDTENIGSIIPRPHSVQCEPGSFVASTIYYDQNVIEAGDAIAWLVRELPSGRVAEAPQQQVPRLRYTLDHSIDAEAYRLSIGPDTIEASASDSAGFFYAMVSLCQLVPLDSKEAISLPLLTIEDKPRFEYRGLMLDCARHFHAKEELLKLLDHMARYKFNRFHWHLTDDEGWRIEINAFPALTQLGAWRGPGEVLEAQFGSGEKRYGGYYSHADIRDIIEYARQRHIIIIPEIDVPGHCRAALKSMPELLLEKEDQSDYNSVQLYKDNVLNPALPGTYHFLHKVLDEVADLFPGPYIHIGADEVPTGVWENSPACREFMTKHGYQSATDLQSHLLRDLQEYLQQKGKQLVGWEEAIQGGQLDQSAILGAWSELSTTTAIAEAGYRVIACPAPYAYLDLAWDNHIEEPGFHWAGTSNLETCYAFEPYQDSASAQARKKIIGVQALLWSELITSPQRLEYMLFPRLLALAETAWSPQQSKDWDSFQTRLAPQLKKLDQLGVAHHDTASNAAAAQGDS